MKVLFFIPSLSTGGAERVLVNLINNFPIEGYDIHLKTLFKDDHTKIKRDITYSYVFPYRFRGNVHLLKLLSPKQLYQFCFKNEHFDVAVSYLHSPTMRIIAGCTDKNTKLVNWIHNEFKKIEELSYMFRSKKEFFRCMQRYDRTVHVAQSAMEAFDKLMPQLTSTSCVIYNTIESNVILSKSKLNDGIPYKSNEFNLISVGRFTQAKAFDRLVRITAKLRRNGISAHLYLLGKGALADMYLKEANNLGIKEYVTLLGFQENPYKYVAHADLFVCSSIHEGYSTAVTESLIVGTPVITTNCSGMSELLGDNEYGIITGNDENKLYEAVLSAITTDGCMYDLKRKAELRSSFFSKDKTVKDVVELFNDLVNGK